MMCRGRLALLLVALSLLAPRVFGDDRAFSVSAWHELDEKTKARALDETARSIEELDLFNFAIDARGGFSLSTLERLGPWLAKVRAKGGRVHVTFIDWVGSAHDVVATPALRRAFARAAASGCAKHGLEGIDLDFEGLAPSQRGAFTELCREAANELHARGKKLWVTVIARTSETGLEGAAAAQDLAALGGIADRLNVMTYDYAGPWSGPGPIGPLDWAKDVIAHVESLGVPRSKLALGVPLYGREWPGGKNLGADAACALATKLGVTPTFDAKRGEVTFQAGERTVWFSDGRAVAAKVAFARAQGLAGVCLFSLRWARDEELRALERARSGGLTGGLTPR